MLEKKKIEDALTGPLAEKGYRLYSVDLSHDKDGDAIHIMVDRDAPISLDEIVEVSSLIDPIMDELNPIDGPYTLDVSSLGSEKPIALERLGFYVGQYVNIHLSHPYKGENIIEGDLAAIDEKEATIVRMEKGKKKTLLIPRGDIDKARLAIKF